MERGGGGDRIEKVNKGGLNLGEQMGVHLKLESSIFITLGLAAQVDLFYTGHHPGRLKATNQCSKGRSEVETVKLK